MRPDIGPLNVVAANVPGATPRIGQVNPGGADVDLHRHDVQHDMTFGSKIVVRTIANRRNVVLTVQTGRGGVVEGLHPEQDRPSRKPVCRWGCRHQCQHKASRGGLKPTLRSQSL